MIQNILLAMLFATGILVAQAPASTPQSEICVTATEAKYINSKTAAAFVAAAKEFDACTAIGIKENYLPGQYHARFDSAVATTAEAIIEYRAKQTALAAKTAIKAENKFNLLMTDAFGTSDPVQAAANTQNPQTLEILQDIYDAEQVLQQIVGTPT